jgi:hypothetical protein
VIQYNGREATDFVSFTNQILAFCCFFSDFALLKILADLDSPLDMCSENIESRRDATMNK